MNRIVRCIVVFTCCALATMAGAAERSSRKRPTKSAEKNAVTAQTGIGWHTSPESASAAADRAERPIFWFRHVGELTGPMCSASHRTRVVTLAEPAVQRELAANFVPMSANMEGMPGAGRSVGHLPGDEPGLCPPRLAHQNCQVLFLTPGLEIFHAATGFVPADDLVREMQFAENLFTVMKKKPAVARQTVVETHRKFLRDAGYTEQELVPPADGFGKLLALSGVPLPFDGGADGGDPFAGIARGRIMRDHQYLIQYPLVTLAEFQRDPSPLVGMADFTFQSGEASGRPTGK